MSHRINGDAKDRHMTNLTTTITRAKVVLSSLHFATEDRRELAHAIEYASSAPSEHSEKRLIAAVGQIKSYVGSHKTI